MDTTQRRRNEKRQNLKSRRRIHTGKYSGWIRAIGFRLGSWQKQPFRIYQENGFKYNYDEYYSRDEIQIGEFNISELAKEFDLPKETMRRKILELEKAKVIRKQGKKLIFDKSAYNLVKPINQIKITSKYISKVN